MYTVELKSCGNPDHYENPYKSVSPSEIYKAETIEECRKAVEDYIDKYDLGGGNWNGGNVYRNEEYVGHISYNGRFWDKEHEYGRERK